MCSNKKYLAWGAVFVIGIMMTGIQCPASAGKVALNMVAVVLDDNHLVWAAANKLAGMADTAGITLKPLRADPTRPQPETETTPDLLLLPVRSLVTQVPALQVLELPFFYNDLESVHRAVDGGLGDRLKHIARGQGWEILAFWDEGQHNLSGNRRYSDHVNLTGMEFLLLRPDPIGEKQFTAFDAWPRAARPQTRQQLLKECLVGSRAATLQQLWREGLHQVHLALSLTQHRYEGWVVIAPIPRWQAIPRKQQEQLATVIAQITRWQRQDAQAREQAALKKLTGAGIRIYRLNALQRRGFINRLPPWEDLLPVELDRIVKSELLTLARSGTAGRRDKKPPADALPSTPGS